MTLADFSAYEGLRIRAIPFAEVEACANDWWRAQWQIKTQPATLPKDLRLPAPPDGLVSTILVVSVVACSPGTITVEAWTRNPNFTPQELVQVSLVLRAIESLYHQITINGYSNHPILRI